MNPDEPLILNADKEDYDAEATERRVLCGLPTITVSTIRNAYTNCTVSMAYNMGCATDAAAFEELEDTMGDLMDEDSDRHIITAMIHDGRVIIKNNDSDDGLSDWDPAFRAIGITGMNQALLYLTKTAVVH